MHFYDKDGKSHHKIIGKNGKERTTSIRDARQLGLVPSVTTVMDVQAKPALIQWLQNELLQAAIDFPFHPEEYDEKFWRKQTLAKMKQKGEKAATRGTEIHDKLETYFKSGIVCHKDKDYITESIKLIQESFPSYVWRSEESRTSKTFGFGGCVDLWGSNINNECVIIDFKTKDKTDIKDMVQYDDHKIQLAAYQKLLELPENTKRYNLFISVSEETPGLCKLVEASEFDKHWGMFAHLLEFWKLKNNYDPCEVLCN